MLMIKSTQVDFFCCYCKIRMEKTLDEEYYSKNSIRKSLYLSRQIVFKPILQKYIFKKYLKINKSYKDIYSLYLYYCYLLDVFPKNHSKQYLLYLIRKVITKLDGYLN